MSRDDESAITGTKVFYDLRADTFDARFEQAMAHDPGWRNRIASLQQAMAQAGIHGDVLELACGTGLFTQYLVGHCHSLDAIDSSKHSLELNRARVHSDAVTYVLDDIYSWDTTRRYDCIFFSLWLCHVPPDRFSPFWKHLRKLLKPDGFVFFIDGARSKKNDGESPFQERELGAWKGLIVMVNDAPELIDARIRAEGWEGGTAIIPEGGFLYGLYRPRRAHAAN